MKKLLAVAGALMLAGSAFSQVPTYWLNTVTGQESDGVITYLPGAYQVNVSVAQLRDASGYTKSVPTSGQTLTVGGSVGCNPQYATSGNCVSVLQMTPAGTLSTLTIKTPLYPVDGERFRIFSTQTITTLTMTASQSQTLNGAVTSMTANTGYEWIYSAGSTSSNGTWDRIL